MPKKRQYTSAEPRKTHLAHALAHHTSTPDSTTTQTLALMCTRSAATRTRLHSLTFGAHTVARVWRKSLSTYQCAPAGKLRRTLNAKMPHG